MALKVICGFLILGLIVHANNVSTNQLATKTMAKHSSMLALNQYRKILVDVESRGDSGDSKIRVCGDWQSEPNKHGLHFVASVDFGATSSRAGFRV